MAKPLKYARIINFSILKEGDEFVTYNHPFKAFQVRTAPGHMTFIGKVLGYFYFVNEKGVEYCGDYVDLVDGVRFCVLRNGKGDCRYIPIE